MCLNFNQRNFLNLISFLFIFLLAQDVVGETATGPEMTQTCRNWLAYVVNAKGDWGGSNSPQIADSYDIMNDGLVIGRYFEVSPNGFVFVPVLKEMVPIKAYSETSRLDFSDTGGIPALIKDVMAMQLSDFIKGYGSLTNPQSAQGAALYDRSQRESWNYFLKSDKEFLTNLNLGAKASMSTIGPLLTTVWRQGAPYNELCPLGDGGRTVVGCVATAASQILAYHKWPPEGTGNRTISWAGDVSCGGSGVYPSISLSADFSDPYDWANIPDSCTADGPLAQRQALSELCYETGIAYRMIYGVCGSGTYVPYGMDSYPDYFRYRDSIIWRLRPEHNAVQWSSIIRNEMTSGRPILYRIKLHAIVCDGWQDTELFGLYHMNYGWGGNQNAWFALDDLYCAWEGCSVSEEYMLTNITPDRRAYFSADTVWGDVPLTVNFSGQSSFSSVDKWVWYFGDGDSSLVQSPTHIYNNSGSYDVMLKTFSETDTGVYLAENKIAALADSIVAENISVINNTTVEIAVNCNNSAPLRKIVIPITFSGPLNLEYADYSVAGCRAEYFDRIVQPGFDYQNHQTVFILENTSDNELDLPPGSGPIIKLYFTVPVSAKLDEIATISFDAYSSYAPLIQFGNDTIYTPYLGPGVVSIAFLCGDANSDGKINLIDVSFIISYLYRGGPEPSISRAADVNLSGNLNLLDVSHIISYLYRGGSALDCGAEL